MYSMWDEKNLYFKNSLTNGGCHSIIFNVRGALVKWLRLRPLTAASGVRIPYASPENSAQGICLELF